MDTKIISTGVRYTSLLDSYVRPEADRPKLSEVQDCDDVPIIDLGSEDRTSIVQQIGNACLLYVFFQPEMVSRSDQGMWCPLPKKAATELKKLPILASTASSLLLCFVTNCDGRMTVAFVEVETTEEKADKGQPELGRQLELLENQPKRLGRQPELSWSTENPSVVLATIAALIGLAGVMFQNPSDNPFHSRPATMTLLVTALLIYGFAIAQTRPIILDGKQQQIFMWRIIYYYYRLLNSLVLISKVVCQACIVSLFIPYGLGWNVYVACASTLCFGVAVWAILRNFAPSCVVRLVPCMGLTGSNGGSEKNDGVLDCGNDGRNRIAESNGSPVCGSFVVSENHSSSQQGSTNSDVGSHSGHCKAEQSQLKHTCEHGVPSHQTDHSTQANGKTANTGNAVSQHII
ncbi:hypothetical protein RHGRI_002713 [Rhododendron griersonianum]|uniref:PGG domain-containing protein n=1 Tax=Rhododendron griersonianum TaxID=479676 RepID=A0AAV6LQL7_9ERIC|nr:hypothetical protein RHGRI_002713 [Rhododendron griersonianum]